MSHHDYPTTVTITYRGDTVKRILHCENAGTDEYGDWFILFVDDLPIEYIPREVIQHIEITYNAKEKEETKH